MSLLPMRSRRLCKRYNLKLEESLRTCPICLENVNHSIQLSCGESPSIALLPLLV